MKTYMRRKNTSGRLEELQKLVEDSANQVSAQDWARCCRHVHGEEKRYWNRDGLLDDIAPVLVDLEDSDSSSSSEDEWDRDSSTYPAFVLLIFLFI